MSEYVGNNSTPASFRDNIYCCTTSMYIFSFLYNFYSLNYGLTFLDHSIILSLWNIQKEGPYMGGYTPPGNLIIHWSSIIFLLSYKGVVPSVILQPINSL